MKHIALYAAVVAGASLPLLGTTAASGAVPPPAAGRKLRFRLDVGEK